MNVDREHDEPEEDVHDRDIRDDGPIPDRIARDDEQQHAMKAIERGDGRAR